MSDEGFHGGDFFTISANGGAMTNRTPGRKSFAELTVLAGARPNSFHGIRRRRKRDL